MIWSFVEIKTFSLTFAPNKANICFVFSLAPALLLLLLHWLTIHRLQAVLHMCIILQPSDLLEKYAKLFFAQLAFCNEKLKVLYIQLYPL